MPDEVAAQVSALRRFEERISSVGDHWVWTGGLDANGYGTLGVGGAGSRRAHRWSYEYHVAAIPKGLQIDHLCRIRACVNPYHLEPVTPRVNTLRGNTRAAFLAAQTHCKYGHPFDEDNTAITRRGHRACRACGRTTSLANYHRKRASCLTK